MIKFLVTPNEGDTVEIYGVSEAVLDFSRATLRVNFSDEGGPRTGEYALDQLKDVDWEVVEGTREFERNLTTYQQRAVQNLPPVLPGAPDYTYEPNLPKIVKPTPAPVPEMSEGQEAEAEVRSRQSMRKNLQEA